ncbi:MAG: sugar ABC transporter substrate-binding protein [Trueperaceae bacterium]
MQTRWLSAVRWMLVTVLVATAGLITTAQAQDAELTVWLVRENYEMPLDDWYAEHPDVQINYEVVPWEHTLNQLILSAAANRAPDVVVVDFPWIAVLAALGHLEPLDGYIDGWPQGDLADFFDASWAFGQYDDMQYTVPFAHMGRALYYRADWFEEAGLEEPRTWDDVIEAGQALTVDGRWGLSMRGARDDGSVQGFLPVFASFGGQIVDGVPQFDSDAGVQSLQLMHDMVHEYGIMSPETHTYGSSEARGAFMGGQAAMSIIGSHIAPAVENAGTEYGDFRMTHIPTPSADMEPRNVATSFSWAVHAQSEHKDEAAEFVRYLTRPENSFIFNAPYMEAVRESVYDMPAYLEAKPWTDFILADIPLSEPMPSHPLYGEMSDAIQLALQEVLSNPNADVEAVAADLAASLSAIVD